ncbi:c-type cytochrome biogenesis protein CcmI [Bradyrhizobium sp. AUGA SZCCT0283]|uniref:c-type cytochrome biogenesis protein CcmI n=1 Tax=Bradyrhizobium sp. AUGA SZCCT0283 TaxID=2807671 RepID=UPI001BAC1F51|nr:c-type cytochrome biogenesis protein CcmI [Bradyrhizobium sp. AUGA SZCCT0283]MBR1275966.1 c-type cytochrome biogenesis protein CcmI [Bradyrhizobium sp. AUGA SZCCT0283]
MTLWLICTAMISAAAVLLSAPFIRRYERTRLAAAGQIAVYRDQLREIETEAAQGLIDQAQAESAGLEIKRRIIAVNRAEDTPDTWLAGSERKFALVAVTSIVVFGSVALYAVIGSPDLPSATPQAISQRPAFATRSIATQGLVQPSTTAAPEASRGAAQSSSTLPPVEEMIQRVQNRLQKNPQDADGWRLLGWSYFNIERFADAAKAYARAVELRPDFAEYRSARGEALVRDAGDVVTTDARKEFEETLKSDPRNARARFFMGLAKEQDGDKDGAAADWQAVVAEADPSEPWLPDLRQRLKTIRADAGEVAASKPKLSAEAMQELLRSSTSPVAPPAEAAGARGPSAQDVRNAETMAPQDRSAMIRNMVDGLAARLEQSPRDAEGWIKLIRSRVVLGETEQAKASLQRALAVFAEESGERTRIADAAKQLGIAP